MKTVTAISCLVTQAETLLIGARHAVDNVLFNDDFNVDDGRCLPAHRAQAILDARASYEALKKQIDEALQALAKS
jgi:hypothetical protein